ncbi:MAG: hypothetical protein M9958_05615 [Chitinophagales bacterium]|nr:hypothetical protein [Chitinophagales bacterium]
MATNLESRKLHLITYIAELKDEKFFEKIENYVLRKNLKKNDSDFPPFTVEELIERIKTSEEDYKNGHFKSQEELEEESANW